MNEPWLEVLIPVPAAAADLVCQELAEIGCAGVTVAEKVLDTFIPPDPDQELAGPQVLRAYFPPGTATEPLRREIRERLDRLAGRFPELRGEAPEVRPVRQEDWAEGWKQHFPPVRIGRRLVIRPSWEPWEAAPGEAVVTLDPGMAFGTGTHGTTRLCLEALAECFEESSPPRRVLDVGAGSGILAIAAASLGAERVLGCEIDPEACAVARENVERNGAADRVEMTCAPLEELEGGFEVVLANILAEENVRLAPHLVRRLAPGGRLILSGILAEKEGLVREGFAPFFAAPPLLSVREDWVCLVYRREG